MIPPSGMVPVTRFRSLPCVRCVTRFRLRRQSLVAKTGSVNGVQGAIKGGESPINGW